MNNRSVTNVDKNDIRGGEGSRKGQASLSTKTAETEIQDKNNYDYSPKKKPY